MMAIYKRTKFIPQWGSYKGLQRDDWDALNRDEEVELDSVPAAAEEYLEKTKSSKSKKESK